MDVLIERHIKIFGGLQLNVSRVSYLSFAAFAKTTSTEITKRKPKKSVSVGSHETLVQNNNVTERWASC